MIESLPLAPRRNYLRIVQACVNLKLRFSEQAMKASALSVLLLAIGCETAAMAAPFNFDCSAPIGRDSQIWRTRPEAPPFHVRGRIVPMRLDPLPRNPQQRDGYSIISSDNRGVDVTVIDNNEGNAITFGVGPGPEAGRLQTGVMTARDGRENRMVIESLAWRPGDRVSISFELSILAGRAVLRVGTREIPLDISLGANSQIRISCTGGDFHLEDLEMND